MGSLLEEKKPRDLKELTQFCGVLEEEKEGEWDEIINGIYQDRKRKPIRQVQLDD